MFNSVSVSSNQYARIFDSCDYLKGYIFTVQKRNVISSPAEPGAVATAKKKMVCVLHRVNQQWFTKTQRTTISDLSSVSIWLTRLSLACTDNCICSLATTAPLWTLLSTGITRLLCPFLLQGHTHTHTLISPNIQAVIPQPNSRSCRSPPLKWRLKQSGIPKTNREWSGS